MLGYFSETKDSEAGGGGGEPFASPLTAYEHSGGGGLAGPAPTAQTFKARETVGGWGGGSAAELSPVLSGPHGPARPDRRLPPDIRLSGTPVGVLPLEAPALPPLPPPDAVRPSLGRLVLRTLAGTEWDVGFPSP